MIYAENASALHKAVGDLLEKSPLFNTKILQEVCVKTLFPSYENNKDRYDFVLPKYKLIIECDGIQHFEWNQHFNKSYGGFVKQKSKDSKKEEIASLNGWVYIHIPYNQKDLLDSLLYKQYIDLIPKEHTEKTIVVDKSKDFTKQRRKEMYQLAKKFKKEANDRKNT